MRNSPPKLRFARRLALPHLGAATSLLAAHTFLSAQTAGQHTEPYAAIDRQVIDYAGPGRDAAHDLTRTEIRIGVLVPLRGPRQAEGDALLQAARMAIEDEAANPLPEGRRLSLVARDESGPWGRASSEIIYMVTEDQVAALLTSADGGAAHLTEQVGNRLGVPVVTLSSDATTTQINIPWLFRIPPSDTAQAEAIAEDIYRQRRLRKVLLVTEEDHDARAGSAAFGKAARRLGAPSPAQLTVAPISAEIEPYLTDIREKNSEALVLWTGPQTAAQILSGLAREEFSAPIYLCQKAAQEPVTRLEKGIGRGNVWVAAARPSENAAGHENFEQRYREKTGTLPSLSALAAYDAVRLVAAALRQSGPNRARLRDSLAKGRVFPGLSGAISFDGAGNNQAAVTLIPLQ